MLRRRKTEVRIETWEETILHGVDRHAVSECDRCPGRPLMVSPERLHQVLEVPVREIWRGVDSEHLHYIETQSGELLVCVKSLRVWLTAAGKLLSRKAASGRD